VLQYDFEAGSESLDLIMIYARNHTAAANGRWGYYCIYIKGDGTDTPSEVPGADFDWQDGEDRSLGSVDSDGYKLMVKGDETEHQAYSGQFITTIVLPVSVANPTSVKVVVKGTEGPGKSRNGHGSLGEIEFYGKAK
jgi:hypothetical protein